MKRLLIIAAVVIGFAACGDSGSAGGEGGAMDDGIHTNDRDGALQDTGTPYTPATDTAKGEDRVDVQERH